MTVSNPRVAGLIALCGALALATPAALAKKTEAASPFADIEQLKQEALAAFDGYAYRKGVAQLERALSLAAERNLSRNAEMADVHALLGIAAISGKSDTYRGIHHFVKALRLSPQVELPKNLVTPELIKLFGVAKRTVRALGQPPRLTITPSSAEGRAAEQVKGARGLDHDPVDEARRGFAIAIKAAVGVDIRAKNVFLFYRAAGKVQFTNVRMKRRGNVFRGEIPAEMTKGRYVHYYIEARDPRGSAVATNGSARGPNVVTLK